jgi:hypothetical protein
VVDVQPDADALAERVVVMARHEREHLPAARQPERVQDLGAAERLVHHLGLQRAGVVVHHVVGPQQHFGAAAPAADVASLLAAVGNAALEHAQFDLHVRRVEYLGGQEHALAHEIGDEAVHRAVIDVVGRVPLLDAALVQDSDLVGKREGLVLIVRH